MSSLAFTEAAALQAASAALLTEIRDLSVRVSAVMPLVQEFRAAAGIAILVAPRPANVGDNIIRSSTCSTGGSSRAVQIP